MTYEVEIRFVADSSEEAFTQLPFLEESLGEPKEWRSEIIGQSIFADGRLLRLGWSMAAGEAKQWGIGYKGPDIGEVANIREEWGETVTNGIADSAILAQLDMRGSYNSTDALLAALADAGHAPFMHFAGVDLLGYVESLAVHTKLARCPAILDDRVLVELEMEAESVAAARDAESKLMQIANEYGILDLLNRDEPPTMLYKKTVID